MSKTSLKKYSDKVSKMSTNGESGDGSNIKIKISKKKKGSGSGSGSGSGAASATGAVAGMEVTSAHGLLLKFLEDRRFKDSDGGTVSKSKVTHTSMGKPFGSFCINDSDLPLFHKLVTSVLKEGKVYPHLVERHSEVAPMIIDFDFRFDSKLTKRQYKEEHVQKIVDAYMGEIRKMFHMSAEEEEEKLVAFVFQRDAPYAWKKVIKDGLHIVFPYIVSRPEIQFIIREAILKQMPTVLADLAKNLRNGWGDVVDRAVIEKTGWMMYGSTKPKCDPYKLTFVYDSEGDAVDIDENYEVEKMVDLFSIRNKGSCVTGLRKERKEDIEKYLSRKTAHKKMAKKKIKVVYDFEMIKKYVSCLSVERADDQRKWMEVGWCLYNISNDSEMLKLWVMFSKKSSKFEAGACEKYWASGAASKYAGITVGSLKYWASIDDPDAYKEIKANDLNELIDKSADGTHNSVAKVMKALYEDSFASVVDSKSTTWYMYDGNMWRQSPQAIDLVKKMSNDLIDVYCGRVNFLNDAMSAEGVDDETSNDMVTKTSKLCDLINNLGKTPFKNNVLKECQEEFHNPDFKDLLDANLYLLGMENGIYDLKNFEFRAGRPDDYVSLSAGASFMEYDEEDDTIQEVYDFLKKTYVDEEVRHFVLKYLASTLDGYLAEEAFYIWHGNGSNGKSIHCELVCKALGEYVEKLPISILTQKRSGAENASPMLMSAKNKRFVYLDEPDAASDHTFNSGALKEYTGGDRLKGRGMFQDPDTFKPQFTLSMLCNDIPKAPPTDDGAFRRFRVIPHDSKFIDNLSKPRSDHPIELQFKKDPTLKKKLDEWVDAFMAILIHYYKIYREEGLKDKPEAVMKAKLEYQEDCDAYVRFVNDFLEKADDERVVIGNSDLERSFRSWFEENYDGEKVPNRTVLKAYLSKRLGKKHVVSKGIKGYLLKADLDEDKIEEDSDIEDEFTVES